MLFVKGDRVRHPSLHEWGIGKVLEDSDGHSVRVFFIGAGERRIALSHVQLIKSEGEEDENLLLDNLSHAEAGQQSLYRTPKECIEAFFRIFPDGFSDKQYYANERDYKWKAHLAAEELLSQHAMDDLLQRGDFPGVTNAALRVLNATNLVFPNEKMALKDGLRSPEGTRLFAESLHSLLYGSATMQERFTIFADALNEIGAAKWTTASYFLFIRFPQEHMFVKPTVTQHAAAACRFELNYRSTLNWLTYHSVLRFAGHLSQMLEEYKPKDMIDVQSFMWCIEGY